MSVRDEIVAYCYDNIGCSYDWTPSGGVEGVSYNCSYLSTCAYAAAGIDIPSWQGHQNGDGSQSDWVRRAGNWTDDPDELQPGDLVFFGDSPYDTSHVGVSLGGWDIIDSIPNGGVQQRTLYGSFVGGGWPLEDVPSGTGAPVEFDANMRATFPRGVNIRDYPSTTRGNIVDEYEEGGTCYLTGVAFNEGRVWGRYVGQSSGRRRYVALGELDLAEVSQ